MAQLSSLRTLESFVENLNFENRKDVQVRHIGGKTVIITFPSIECLEEIEEGKSLEWIKGFMEDLKPWSEDACLEKSRLIWLRYYGVPLHLWNANTFRNIANI